MSELFKLIGNESTRNRGLEQLAFYIKEFKSEIGSSNDFYLLRQNEIINKIKQTPQNVMSKNINKYANDLEDIVQHCTWYLFDPICVKHSNIDLLHFFIKGLTVAGEAGYDESILQIRIILLDRMWKLVFFENQLPYTIQEKLIDVYPEFLIKRLTDILEQIYSNSFDESDLMLVKIDLIYQKILRLCQLYRNAFKVAYTTIAKKMMQCNSGVAQTFLKSFLNDVKGSMKLSEFPHHYEDELVNYVLIFSECRAEDDKIIRHFSSKLKESNYLQYFILVTHFPMLRAILDVERK